MAKQSNKISRYLGMGLNATEIAKILDISPRTCQRLIKKSNIRPLRAAMGLRAKVIEYLRNGGSYSEAAARFGISRTTAYNWARAERLGRV